MGKEKIVLDTNILISALGWKGNPNEVFRRVVEGEFELIISQNQLDEIKEVMNYAKLGFTEDQKSRFIAILINTAKIVKTSGKLKVIKEDPDDDIILETAVENNAGYIISGDHHLLKIKEYLGIKIVTVSEFLKLFNSNVNI